MKLWLLPWLLPVAMVGVVVFVSIVGYPALAAVPVLAALPFLWRGLFPDSDDPDADVHYWRLGGR